MGNAAFSRGPPYSEARLVGSQDLPIVTEREPDFQWKIYGFSALLERGAVSVNSDLFHCCGYSWYLRVAPMQERGSLGEPFVAAWLLINRDCFKTDCVVDAKFELSIYNHSNGSHHGRRATYNFRYTDFCSKCIYFIPLSELQNSSDFLVDDTCIFGLDILRASSVSTARNAKGVTIQHVFLQKKGFIQGNYTCSIQNTEMDSESKFYTPKFDIGEYKWCLRIDPCGVNGSIDSISIYLCLDNSNILPIESPIMAEFSISILNHNDGKHIQQKDRTVFSTDEPVWGWSNFICSETLKDPAAGFLVDSRCTIQAEVMIIGSSNHVW